jgi:hypothetical protein
LAMAIVQTFSSPRFFSILCTTPWNIPLKNVVLCSFRYFQHTCDLSIWMASSN